MSRTFAIGGSVVAVAILAASSAGAAEMKPSLSLGGYSEALIGGILDEDMGADTSAVDVRYDSEIQFNGRATLDSGLKIHARAELEGQIGGGGDRIDEYFLSLSGAFGNVILGGTGGAPVKMLTSLSGSWATGVGDTHDFDSDDWTESVAGKGTFGVIQHARLDTGDANKITYISPKFGGFQIGMTYSPNKVNDDDGSRVNAETGMHDGLEGAVNYSGKFGDVGFAVGAGMTAYQGSNKAGTGQTCVIDSKVAGGAIKCTPNKNPTANTSDWLVAARLDFGGGFRVAVAHKRTTNENEATQGQLTDVGVRYVMGANSFSVGGSMGEMDESGASYSAVTGSYARALGPGVKWHTNLIWNESDNGMSGAAQKQNSGLGLTSGLVVSF